MSGVLGLAKLLKQFGVKSKNVREGGWPAQPGKGYERSQFVTVWEAYLGGSGNTAAQGQGNERYESNGAGQASNRFIHSVW
jgi:hypothetical protein